jgi:branched-chain amino acid aminotransferase
MMAWVETSVGGGLVEQEDATVSIFDHGFTVGDGVFETLKTVNGKPFALDRHLRRLNHSASLLELVTPTPEQIQLAITEVVRQEECVQSELGRLRVTITAGNSELGSKRSQAWTLVVAWSASSPWPASCKVIVSGVLRNERSPLASAKTTSYAENALALHRATAHGAQEAVLLNLAGNVCEATGSNVFIVKDGVVITPRLEDGCLGGITRELLLEWMDGETPFEVRSVTRAELMGADEAFLTSSTRDIQAIHQIDEVNLHVPGPITSRLKTLFAEHSSKELS